MNTLTKLTIVGMVIGSMAGYALGSSQVQTATAEPIPGQPSTYTEKYQCPFHENVNAKGCQVPPNIECNADWTECHPKEIVAPAPVSVPPTPAPVSKPISKCEE